MSDDFDIPAPQPGDEATELDLVYEDLFNTQKVLRQLLNLIDNDGLNPSLAGPIIAKARELVKKGPR